MAKRRFPDALEMRELKYGDRPAQEKDRVAQALRAEGRHSEAILLYDGRTDHPFVAEEVRWAAENGDAFLLLSLRKMGAPVDDSHLRGCAAAAEAKGRWMDARQVHLARGDAAALARIAPNLPGCLAPAPAAPAPPQAPPAAPPARSS